VVGAAFSFSVGTASVKTSSSFALTTPGLTRAWAEAAAVMASAASTTSALSAMRCLIFSPKVEVVRSDCDDLRRPARRAASRRDADEELLDRGGGAEFEERCKANGCERAAEPLGRAQQEARRDVREQRERQLQREAGEERRREHGTPAERPEMERQLEHLLQHECD